VSGEETITYGELARRAARTAAFLHERGVRPGDRVAVLARNTPRYVESLFAAAQAGGALVPLDHQLVPRELSAILEDAQPRIVLFEAGFEGTVEALRANLPEGATWCSLDRKIPGYPFAGGEKEEAAAGPPAAVNPDDAALIVYGAGPEGEPRGAVLSHRNLLFAAVFAALELSLSRNDIFLSCAPFPFPAGTGRLLRFLLVGATVVFADFEPSAVLDAVRRHRATHLLFTPGMLARILDVPGKERFDLSSLRLVIYGGAPVPPDLVRRAMAFFPCGLARAHGQPEAAGVLAFLHPDDHRLAERDEAAARRLASVGKEALGVEVRVADDAGRTLPPGEVGELVARGPNVFRGYFRDPALTAQVVRQGWLYTGEAASVDEDGYLFVVERKRDLLVVDGIAVSPRELERVIAACPGVREVAVVGCPDPVRGEVPVAMVVPEPGAPPGEADVVAHCRRNMAPFKVPAAVEFLDALPRNSQGKVLRARLREQAARRTSPLPPRRPPR